MSQRGRVDFTWFCSPGLQLTAFFRERFFEAFVHLRFLGLWAFVLVGFISPASALDPQRPLTQALLRTWQTNQGLPRSVVLKIYQTKEGYLWLGTQNGLYRFDGVRFAPIAAEQLRNSWIQDLCEDQQQNLWIATDDGGLIRWNQGRAHSLGKQDGLPSEDVRRLLVSDDGLLWAGTARGLVRYEQGKFVVCGKDDGLPDAEIHALASDAEGKLWVATAGPQFFVRDGTRFTEINLSSPLAGSTVQAIQVDREGVVWIASSVGIVRRTKDQERIFTVADGLGSDFITGLIIGRNGEVLAGTKAGLSRIQGDRVESFATEDGLSQSNVMAVCEDREGSLWVGTKYGLNQLVDRRTLLPFTTSEGLPSNRSGPIVQDRSGQVWVGTLDAGLASFSGRQFAQMATTSDGLPSQRVISLAVGQENELWIGTDRGLCLLRGGAIVETFATDSGLPANEILCLCCDDSGVLWVGTSRGLVERRDGEFVASPKTEWIGARAIQALSADNKGNVLAAVPDFGVVRLAGDADAISSSLVTKSSDVVAMLPDAEGRLWMANRGRGLCLLDGDQEFPIGVKDGLYDDDIYGLAVDENGRLWMACSRGIFSVVIADLLRYVRDRNTPIVSTPFSPTDALRTIECRSGVQPAVWKMDDGRVWFSTIRGVIVVDPQGITRPLLEPSVLIDEVRVNGEEATAHQLQHLPPGRTNFDFHYTALSFVSPNRITFRYRLEGFDQDWVQAGSRREAFYTNLSPGPYRFRVQAVNADGVMTEAAAPVAFVVRPHFYRTPQFALLVCVACIGAAWFAYRWRLRQMKDRWQVVLGERNRIARELHDTLIQGFSGVTMQMQALAARLQTASPERKTLAEIIHDAGGCLSEARRSVAGLRNVSENDSGLSAALAQSAQQLTEASEVRLQLRLGDASVKLTPDTEYNILRVVQEAIANAVKHAGANVIEVTQTVNQDELVVSIRDDGAGFDVAAKLSPAQAGHYGMIGMRERAKQIGAELDWQSAPRQGTKVTLRCRLPTIERKNG